MPAREVDRSGDRNRAHDGARDGTTSVHPTLSRSVDRRSRRERMCLFWPVPQPSASSPFPRVADPDPDPPTPDAGPGVDARLQQHASRLGGEPVHLGQPHAASGVRRRAHAGGARERRARHARIVRETVCAARPPLGDSLGARQRRPRRGGHGGGGSGRLGHRLGRRRVKTQPDDRGEASERRRRRRPDAVRPVVRDARKRNARRNARAFLSDCARVGSARHAERRTGFRGGHARGVGGRRADVRQVQSRGALARAGDQREERRRVFRPLGGASKERRGRGGNRRGEGRGPRIRFSRSFGR